MVVGGHRLGSKMTPAFRLRPSCYRIAAFTRTGDIIGVITPSGATSGSFSGTGDLINESGLFTASVSGSYAGIDSTTGRGTGNITLTASATNKTTNVIIYAYRHVIFAVLDVSSNNPDVQLAPLQ